MSNSEVVLTVLFCFFGGIFIGLQIGMVVMHDLFKKKLNSKCAKCKHFKQCLGFWEKKSEKGNCKLFMKEKKQSKKENSRLKKLESKVEMLDECVTEAMWDFDDQIERLENEIFDKQKNKRKK